MSEPTDEAAAESYIERFVDERDVATLEAFMDPGQIVTVGPKSYALADAIDELGEARALEVAREVTAADAWYAAGCRAVQKSDGSQCAAGDDAVCGRHEDSRSVLQVDAFDQPPAPQLRDALVDECGFTGTTAFKLATVAGDVEELWRRLTALEDHAVGDDTLSAYSAAGRARDVATHPRVDVDGHPFALGNCIASQGASAKNDYCQNSSYGTSLLCGMHGDVEDPETRLDEDDHGLDVDPVAVDGDDGYWLVEERAGDTIVIAPDYELERIDGARVADGGRDGRASGTDKVRDVDESSRTAMSDDQDGVDEPPAPDGLPKYVREGVEKQDVGTLRALAVWADERADYLEAEAEREVAAEADQAVDETPAEWADREDDWEDQLEDAREDADLEGGVGTLTTKTIDGRRYYYLQWREGDTVTSKYVAPVVPAESGEE